MYRKAKKLLKWYKDKKVFIVILLVCMIILGNENKELFYYPETEYQMAEATIRTIIQNKEMNNKKYEMDIFYNNRKNYMQVKLTYDYEINNKKNSLYVIAEVSNYGTETQEIEVKRNLKSKEEHDFYGWILFLSGTFLLGAIIYYGLFILLVIIKLIGYILVKMKCIYIKMKRAIRIKIENRKKEQ